MKPIVEPDKKFRLILIAGVVTAILTYLLMQVLSPILAQYGLFNSWALLESPPSGTAAILGITGGGWSMQYNAWIETHDGKVYSVDVCPDDRQCDPPIWKLMPEASPPSSHFIPDTRGTDCKNLGDYPLNPSGQISECVYVVDASIDLVPVVYFALMSDGSIKYFVLDYFNYFNVAAKHFLISLLLYIVLFVSILRLTKFIAKQIRNVSLQSHASKFIHRSEGRLAWHIEHQRTEFANFGLFC